MMKPEQQTKALEQQRTALEIRRDALLARFSQAATKGKRRRLGKLSAKIERTNKFLNALQGIESKTAQTIISQVPRFAVSSLFLHESFRKLTADKDEQFFFITGSEIDGTFVLDQWAEFAHQQRSMVGVTADQRSIHRLLIKLEEFGHRLLAHFHSHPGNGSDSTRPSGIDESFQKRLESAGYLTVMAIFSRDGFIRFVRLDETFEIEIFGQGVERHENNLFRLTAIDQN